MSQQNRQDGWREEPPAHERRDPMERAANMARNVWDDVRQSTSHFQRWEMPPPGHPVRQFFHGMALPLHLFRALWADPAARRFYVWVATLQSLVILVLSVAMAPSRGKAGDTEERAELAELVPPEALEEEEQERRRFKLEVKLAAEEFEKKIREVSADGKSTTGERARAVAEAAKGLAEAAKADAKTRQALAEERALPAEAEAEAKPREPEKALGTVERFLENIDREVKFWAALFGIMQLVQWVVIALSRDYHDAISREASLLTALEPEDGPLTPRVRLDMRWVRKKISRRIRALLVFMSGLPLIYALTALLYPIRSELLAVLLPAWSAYWLVVFITAKSAYAWTNAEAGPPWFLRGWTWLTTRVPGFRWSFLQRYGEFWTRRTREVFPPAAEMEKQPWAFAGLTLVGTLSMLPLVKCFVRPLIPVAAGHLLVARQQAERAAAPKHLEPPAPPPAASSTAA